MTTGAPVLSAHFWRSRRSAEIAGIAFAVLLLAAMTMMQLATSEASFESHQSDAQRGNPIRLSRNVMPVIG